MTESMCCACWGSLLPGRTEHQDCDVVVQWDGQVVPELRDEGPYPRVCGCGCATCKRAWWRAGRPSVVEGKVVKAGEKAAEEGPRIARTLPEIVGAAIVNVTKNLSERELEVLKDRFGIEFHKPKQGSA